MRPPKNSRAPTHDRHRTRGVGCCRLFCCPSCVGYCNMYMYMLHVNRQRQNLERHVIVFSSLSPGQDTRAKAKLDRTHARPKFEGQRSKPNTRNRTHKGHVQCPNLYLKTCVGTLICAPARVRECTVEGGGGGVYHSICSSHPVFCRLPSPHTE